MTDFEKKYKSGQGPSWWGYFTAIAGVAYLVFLIVNAGK